jgi:hypothetical protein
MNKLFSSLIILLIFTISAIADDSKSVSNVGTTAANFLQIGAGSRAVGMGGAFVATANDVSAMYWNPAGIGQIKKMEAIFIHTEWIADITYDYAGMIFPISGYGTIGANITTLNMGEMEVRTIDHPEGTGEMFDASDMALGLTFGMNLTNRFSIGINVKYITQRIWKERASAFALDLGTLYDTPIKGLRIGASLTNFGTDMKMSGNDLLVYHDLDPQQTGDNQSIFAELETDSWPLPLNFQLGLAMDFINTENHLLTIEADAVHPIDNSESMHLGMEYGYDKHYFLRAGYRHLFLNDNEQGLTLGAGIRISLFGNMETDFSYAYADFGRLENAQRFSLILSF